MPVVALDDPESAATNLLRDKSADLPKVVCSPEGAEAEQWTRGSRDGGPSAARMRACVYQRRGDPLQRTAVQTTRSLLGKFFRD
jgi:hypothetical protein